PRRVGYARKCGMLLTRRIAHTKQEGEKHELEYNFDLLEALGIHAGDRRLRVAVNPRAAAWAGERLREAGIRDDAPVLAVHPAASCPSKIWPAERFAAVADELTVRHGFALVVVGGKGERAAVEAVTQRLHHPVCDLGGRTTVAQLTAVLQRARLLISNDSGPVHLACAVGTPVVSIFGRKQPGLGPKRWGPVGKQAAVLHRDVGCIECFAHDCRRSFACLKAIEVEDVLSAAQRLL
ncbi:MAG: glycosyltransferase family 9 protein, partial [Candidatus Omnitrophica bacterium]|nr:glycosyltransferase family 9 protein [Candidatus Omnitrophota bacterium]